MVFTACWTFPANLGAHTCVYECIIWRYILLLLLLRGGHVAAVCVCAPPEEVCIGLSLFAYATSTSSPPPFSLAISSSHSFIFSACPETCSPAKTQHLRIARRRFVLLAERIYRTSTAMTNGGTFPLGWTIFFEKISGILYANVGEINSPSSCIAKRNGFRFLRRERELILNLFQLRKSIHCFFFRQFRVYS